MNFRKKDIKTEVKSGDFSRLKASPDLTLHRSIEAARRTLRQYSSDLEHLKGLELGFAYSAASDIVDEVAEVIEMGGRGLLPDLWNLTSNPNISEAALAGVYNLTIKGIDISPIKSELRKFAEERTDPKNPTYEFLLACEVLDAIGEDLVAGQLIETRIKNCKDAGVLSDELKSIGRHSDIGDMGVSSKFLTKYGLRQNED